MNAQTSRGTTKTSDAHGVMDALFRISPAVRYVAIYHRGELSSAQRPGLENASASESDKYEELIVNPTLLTLVTQRGNIDCGGARFVLIRYGNFYEVVMPTPDGHVSIGLEPDCDALSLATELETALAELRLG